MHNKSIYSLSTVFDELYDVMSSVLPPAVTSTSTWPLEPWTCSPHTGSSTAGDPWAIISLDDLRTQYQPNAAVFDRAKQVYQELPTFPAQDIYIDRDTGELSFEVALPGYSIEDIDINFEDDHMTLAVRKDNSIKRAQKESGESRVYIRRGLKSSSFEIRVPVPSSRFRVKEAQASYDNGMLTVRVPRLEEHAPHRLQISVAAKQLAE